MKQVMRSTFLQMLFNPYDQDGHISLYIDNGTVYYQFSYNVKDSSAAMVEINI
jgi:hypothetical protein